MTILCWFERASIVCWQVHVVMQMSAGWRHMCTRKMHHTAPRVLCVCVCSILRGLSACNTCSRCCQCALFCRMGRTGVHWVTGVTVAYVVDGYGVHCVPYFSEESRMRAHTHTCTRVACVLRQSSSSPSFLSLHPEALRVCCACRLPRRPPRRLPAWPRRLPPRLLLASKELGAHYEIAVVWCQHDNLVLLP